MNVRQTLVQAMSTRSNVAVFALACVSLFISPALAEEAAPQVEEIIVTAEKRIEPLNEVSQSISVFDADQLGDLHADTLVDLNALAPGVNIAKNEGFRTVVTIRGVGNEANQNTIANPSVSFHLDGIYMASPFTLQTDLLDIERVEVIRGPQGALFGQNSTGGAINVVSVSPVLGEVSSAVSGTLGTFGRIKTFGAVNLPVGSSVAVRASATVNRHDGFSRNVVLDQELDENDSAIGRVRLLWEATASTRIEVSAQVYSEDTNGSAQKGIFDRTPNPRRLAQDFPSSHSLDTAMLGLVITRDLFNSTVKYLFSVQEDHIVSYRDNDRSDLVSVESGAFLPAAVAPEDDTQSTTTHEIQWISKVDSTRDFSWIAGVFVLDTSFEVRFREKIDFGRDGVFDPVSIDQVRSFAPGDYGFISDAITERESVSVYFQGDNPISDQLNLVSGVRLTDGNVDGRVTNFYARSGTDLLSISGTRLTGRTALEYTTTQGALIYGSYTRGFKPGGSNLTYGREEQIAPTLVKPTFVDEVVDALELGVKGRVFDDSVQVWASAYTYDYKNMQYQATDPEVFEGGVTNIPDSSIRGLEVELFGTINSSLQWEARASWLKSEITESHLVLDNVESDEVTNALVAQGFPLFGPEIQRARAESVKDVRNNQLAKAPSFTANASLTHSATTALGELRTNIQYVYRGEYYHRIFNNDTTDLVDGYSVLNASSNLVASASPWILTLSVLNITDEPGVNSKFTDAFGVGATSVELIPPRQFLVRIQRQFD